MIDIVARSDEKKALEVWQSLERSGHHHPADLLDAIATALAAVRAEEREACAKVVERFNSAASQDIAAAIRTRPSP